MNTMTQITHQRDPETGAMRQIVPASVLRQVLDSEGSDYSRPADFSADDEWNTGESFSPLDETVYIVEDGEIVETTIRNCDYDYIDKTTTPRGVAPRYHVRGTDLWTWGVQGNFPTKVRSYETEAEAQAALEKTFVDDFWACDAICSFTDREAAEQFLEDEGE